MNTNLFCGSFALPVYCGFYEVHNGLESKESSITPPTSEYVKYSFKNTVKGYKRG